MVLVSEHLLHECWNNAAGFEECLQDVPEAGAPREGTASHRHWPWHEGRPSLVPKQVAQRSHPLIFIQNVSGGLKKSGWRRTQVGPDGASTSGEWKPTKDDPYSNFSSQGAEGSSLSRPGEKGRQVKNQHLCNLENDIDSDLWTGTDSDRDSELELDYTQCKFFQIFS